MARPERLELPTPRSVVFRPSLRRPPLLLRSLARKARYCDETQDFHSERCRNFPLAYAACVS